MNEWVYFYTTNDVGNVVITMRQLSLPHSYTKLPVHPDGKDKYPRYLDSGLNDTRFGKIYKEKRYETR